MEHNQNELTVVAKFELGQTREAGRAAEEGGERGRSFSGGK